MQLCRNRLPSSSRPHRTADKVKQAGWQGALCKLIRARVSGLGSVCRGWVLGVSYFETPFLIRGHSGPTSPSEVNLRSQNQLRNSFKEPLLEAFAEPLKEPDYRSPNLLGWLPGRLCACSAKCGHACDRHSMFSWIWAVQTGNTPNPKRPKP